MSFRRNSRKRFKESKECVRRRWTDAIRWESFAQVLVELSAAKITPRMVTKPMGAGRGNDRRTFSCGQIPKGRSFALRSRCMGRWCGVVLLVNWLHAEGEKFGDPNAGGVSVGVEVVDKIPIPHAGRPNPLASQSESEAPQAPAKPIEREQKEVTPPDAVKIKSAQGRRKWPRRKKASNGGSAHSINWRAIN